MKRALICLAGAAFMATASVSADTWKGTLSESSCAARHAAEKHGDNAKKHEDCVKKCVESGNPFVLVAGDKIFKIANQDFKDLKAYAGKEVSVTGDLKDETITVSKVEAPKK